MDDFVSVLRSKLECLSSGVPDELYQLIAEYHIDVRFTPSKHDDPYWAHAIGIATPTATGGCFCPHGSEACGDPEIAAERDVRAVRDDHACREIAALDAAFGVTQATPTMRYTAHGGATAKSTVRANAIANEIELLALDGDRAQVKVVMVGAVGNVLAELRGRGYRMYATDFDESLIDRDVAGVRVESGERTLERIAECQIGLITGMTLATESLTDIFCAAGQSGTRLVFFCQTGSNFAAEYLEAGANAVVAERFPFYMLPGDTEFSIFRRK